MTNVEKLKVIYAEKVKAGLLDVKFDFSGRASSATVEQLASEILIMEEAIESGNFKLADFGDGSWVGPVDK